MLNMLIFKGSLQQLQYHNIFVSLLLYYLWHVLHVKKNKLRHLVAVSQSCELCFKARVIFHTTTVMDKWYLIADHKKPT